MRAGCASDYGAEPARERKDGGVSGLSLGRRCGPGDLGELGRQPGPRPTSSRSRARPRPGQACSADAEPVVKPPTSPKTPANAKREDLISFSPSPDDP